MFGRGRTAIAPTVQPVQLPAPIGGLNTLSPGTATPASDCWALYNMTPAERGLRVRLGSRQWFTGLRGASDTELRSLVPFTGSASAGTANKIFAITSTGIWDVTTSTALPSAWAANTAYVIGDRVLNGAHIYICDTNGTSAAAGGPTGTGANIADNTTRWDWQSTPRGLSFGTTSGRAGHGVCHVQVTTAGHFLLYWDEVNGFYVYTESTNTWAAATVSGVTAGNLVFGTVFKGRVWMVEKDTFNLWYLDAGAVSGTATKFGLGTSLKAGGSIRGIWNWSYDGGAGMDDALVVVSDGGDVVIYQGTDPSSASLFGMTGVWQVGAPPAGREIAIDLGGDLLILTRLGLLPMSQLVLGKSVDPAQYATAKISSLFNSLMLTRASSYGWSMRLHPEDNSLVVTVPDPDGTGLQQLVMSMTNRAWSTYRDLDMYCTAAFGGKLYFGDADGAVWINDGNVDGVTLAAPSSYTDIQYAGLSAFQKLDGGRQKQIQLILPDFIGQSASPSFSVDARYDFDSTELATVTAGVGVSGGWDSGVWDASVWGGEYSPTREARGAAGGGSSMAIAWRGASRDRTVLMGFDVWFTSGGPL